MNVTQCIQVIAAKSLSSASQPLVYSTSAAPVDLPSQTGSRRDRLHRFFGRCLFVVFCSFSVLLEQREA